MPTPVGHALAGVAAGCLLAGRSGFGRGWLSAATPLWKSLASNRTLWLFAGLGVLADVDFLFGTHSAYTHSIGATLVVGGMAALLGRQHGPRFAVAAACAYGTHGLLDWLGSDTVEPLGIMALWPLSADYFLSDRYWFTAVCRQYRDLACWGHNLIGLAHEVLVLGPIMAASLYIVHRVTRS